MGSKNKRKNMTEAVTDTRKDTYDWIQCLISALIICVLLFVFVIRVVDVRGTSMWPTLQNGDKMLVSTGLLADYRCTYGYVQEGEDGSISLDAASAALLQLNVGQAFTMAGRA